MFSLTCRLSYTYLMLFCLFLPMYGRGKELLPSCEVELRVHRGTTWKSPPQQSLTVRCPVRHCGEQLNVTWCKLLNTNSCERINNMENLEIRQTHSYVKDELISYLTFKWISIYDDGLYKCELQGYKYGLVSHTINISVSDLHQGVETNDNTDNIAVTSHVEAVSWLPYFYIFGGIALLVTAITALTLFFSFYEWKQILSYKSTKQQEMSTHMIPDLPTGSAPSTPVLQAIVNLKDIYASVNVGTPPSPPSPITDGNQPLANTTNESQVLDSVTYSVINHTKCAQKQHMATKQDKDPEHDTFWKNFD